MIETNPLLNRKKVIEFSYQPCNQEYEDLIGSGVRCESALDTIDKMTDQQSEVSMWWIEQIIVPNAEAEGANPWNPKKGEDAYILYPSQYQADSGVTSVSEQRVITLKYQQNKLRSVYQDKT